MNKTASITITGVLILLALVSTYGFMSGKSDSVLQPAAEQYAILTYYPDSGVPYVIGRQGFSARIFYGDNRVENISLTKEEVKSTPISNAVTGLLARLSQEGYTLVSTSVVLTVEGTRTESEVHCFLKKSN
jgi:hypothetical protein